MTAMYKLGRSKQQYQLVLCMTRLANSASFISIPSSPDVRNVNLQVQVSLILMSLFMADVLSSKFVGLACRPPVWQIFSRAQPRALSASSRRLYPRPWALPAVSRTLVEERQAVEQPSSHLDEHSEPPQPRFEGHTCPSHL